MKIKKLELVGFKSFVDRTIVNFDHDVMGIVGPNGCGKSNIVDAIRWCMGEQSAKHLRGRSMEDVIFSGSDSRSANEFAEVTLTFENDTGDVPIEYRDFPEIAVTRRLHRNGDSEYLINKTQVRLKDVTDLFLGTGVGTKAYSIIEQGKIGLIVSAKPEDRRLLIEEAAGITKYKSKKKQAERKMELTQQNLLRVGDIVAEIERNLGSLKRQAAKAERFISYRKELEDLQLYEASHRYLELTGWIKLETDAVERLTGESESARTTVVTREAELETFRLEALGAEERLEATQAQSFAAENEVRSEEGAIARAQDKLDALRAREAQASREREEVDEQRRRVSAEHAALSEEVDLCLGVEETHATVVAGEEERIAELSASHQEAEQTVREYRQRVSQAQATIASAEAKLAGFERRKQETQARLDKVVAERERLEGERAEHDARRAGLERDIAGIRSGKESSAADRAELEARLLALTSNVTESERLLEEAKLELSQKLAAARAGGAPGAARGRGRRRQGAGRHKGRDALRFGRRSNRSARRAHHGGRGPLGRALARRRRTRRGARRGAARGARRDEEGPRGHRPHEPALCRRRRVPHGRGGARRVDGGGRRTPRLAPALRAGGRGLGASPGGGRHRGGGRRGGDARP